MRPRTKSQQRDLALREERRSHDPVPDSDKCSTCGGYIGSDPQHAWLTRCVCALRKGSSQDADSPALDASRLIPPSVEVESRIISEGNENFGPKTEDARGRLNRQVSAGNGGPDSHTAATVQQGDPMPETQLPTTEVTARPLFAPLETTLSGLLARQKELEGKPLTRMVVETAKELDDDAKRFLAAAESSDARKAVDAAYGVQCFLSRMFKTATDPAQGVRRYCSSLMARWEQERRRITDEERRKREEEARKEQEDQRLAEAAHLEAQGHVEEAHAVLEAPPVPIALPDEKEPAGKVQGVTVIETFKLGEIVDAKLLAGYFVEHPEDLISLMEPKPNEWKRRATSTKGQWVVPGVTFVKSVETRNRG